MIPEAQINKEKNLVAKCIQGERKAQYELYSLYSKAMLNTSNRILSNPTLAEDALQEAFIEVFKKISSFRGDSTIGAWIKRIVINKSINLLKKEDSRVETLDESVDPPEVQENPGDLSFSTEQVSEAIMKLPTGFRTVFSLYLLEGYDHSEISQVLGISESTSKTQYKRAKEKVRNELMILRRS